MPQHKEQWEEQFDKQFCSLYGIKVYSEGKLTMGNPDVDEVKQFISTTRKQAKEEVLNKIDKIMTPHIDAGQNFPLVKVYEDLVALREELSK